MDLEVFDVELRDLNGGSFRTYIAQKGERKISKNVLKMQALEKRLKAEDITFILDHSDELSPEDAKRLSKYKNCILYPPIGYVSDEARIAKQEIFISNMESFLNGKPKNIAT